MEFWLKEENKAAFEYGRQLTAIYSKSFYFSTRLLPKERRWATFALYGFCRYVDNLIDRPRNRSEAELLNEIENIRRELQIAYRTGESEHPILQAFIIVAKKYGVPQGYPLDLLDGMAMDIQHDRYDNFDDLYLFCYRVAGVVGLMMTYVLGYKDDRAFEFAEKLGIAMQLTNILRDIKEDKEIGRIYLPLQELKHFSVTEQDVFSEKFHPGFMNLIKFQTVRAHRYYDLGEFGIPMLNLESQFAIYSASRIYRGILKKMEDRDYNPFLGRIYVPKTRKMGILFHEIVRTRIQQSQFNPKPVI